ncbi:MAG: hypothetical protein QF719_03075 [Chloroflexota bacterium]|jgi:hypothetical protein|nr:hypothetical protein [Chloroflexota bacterium]MDP6508089.1 hypothetical protein [Chloroflexota bacterium]MDP6757184.1 hypothetical protein [Chloroflexota bacterium]
MWATLFLAVGAGAIFQVVWQIGRLMGNGDDGTIFAPLNVAGVVAGMLVMYATGLLVTG